MIINPVLYERRKLIRSRHTRLISELISVDAASMAPRRCFLPRFSLSLCLSIYLSIYLSICLSISCSRCSRTTVGAGLADISNGSVAQTVMEPIIESNTGREEDG